MKLIIDIDESDYMALKEDGVQNHLALADTVIANGIPYEERPQGMWLFTEIDKNYHVYGQCSVCKERNRIGKACRSCGAEMKGGAEE